jgi:hypothetical protein
LKAIQDAGQEVVFGLDRGEFDFGCWRRAAPPTRARPRQMGSHHSAPSSPISTDHPCAAGLPFIAGSATIVAIAASALAGEDSPVLDGQF